MRFLNMLFGGLVGAIPGVTIANLSGENLGLTLIGLLLMIVGFIYGLVKGWINSGWLNRQGVLGALIGLVPGVILWPLDLRDGQIVGYLHYKEIVMLILIAGFLLGLFVGNRRGRRTSTSPA